MNWRSTAEQKRADQNCSRKEMGRESAARGLWENLWFPAFVSNHFEMQ